MRVPRGAEKSALPSGVASETHHIGDDAVALHVLPHVQRQLQLAALDAHIHERGVRVNIALHASPLHVRRQLQRSLQLHTTAHITHQPAKYTAMYEHTTPTLTIGIHATL